MMIKVKVYDPTASDKLSKVRGIGRYLQIIKENFPDWSYISDLKSISFDDNLVFLNPFINFLRPPLSFRKIAKKQVGVIHDLIPLKYPDHFPVGVKGKINLFLNKLTLRNYDLIITDSQASKKDIIDILRLPENKIKVVYPCLPKAFSMNYKVSSIKSLNTKYFILNTGYCLYVGDATWNKNLVNLAKAIKLADVTCVFVGKVFEKVFSKKPLNTKYEILDTNYLDHPWNKELKDFYTLVKDDKRFVFPGFIPDKELYNFYEQSTVNILPSRDEGFGFSYVESAKFGCPSLLSDIAVLREISGNVGLFFDPNNPDEIAEKINKIFTDKKLRQELSNQSMQRAEFFSKEKFKNEFLESINKV